MEVRPLEEIFSPILAHWKHFIELLHCFLGILEFFIS